MISAADFEVEGRDGGICGRNIGLEVFFGDISWQRLSSFC